MQEDENNNKEPPAKDRPDKQKQQTQGGGKRRWLLIGLAGLFLLAGGGYSAYWFFEGRYYEATADAYVNGNTIMLTPQISGTATAIHADDTDLVTRGQPMVNLDPSDARLALQHAEAMLAQTVREVCQLYERKGELQASVVMRETQLAQAQQDYHRNVNLLKIHGVSRQEYQHTRTRWRAAKAALSVVRHQLGGLQALVGNIDLQQHPQVELAASRLEDAYLNLQRMNILAPITGYVAQREVQVGDKVSPGNPLLAIVPLNQVWVEANFKETQLQDMRIGQQVEITADFYGSDVIYHGRVQGLFPGTGSAFSLLPPQNATGNWIKIVQRVPVRINLKRNELRRHPLLLQLSLNTTVDVHDTSGPVLAHASQNKPIYSTDVYRGRLEGAQLLIDRIIAENSGKPGTRAIARDGDGR